MPPNLLADAQPPIAGERFDDLLRCGRVVIERIVSSDRPDAQVYDQPHDEWVLLVQGNACLKLGQRDVHLHPGDHVFIPAHTPHQVAHTQSGTVWLAVHMHRDDGNAGAPGPAPFAAPMATP